MGSDFAARWLPDNQSKGASGPAPRPVGIAEPQTAVPAREAPADDGAVAAVTGNGEVNLSVAARHSLAESYGVGGEDEETNVPAAEEAEFDAAKAAQRWIPSTDTTVTATDTRDYIRVDEVVKARTEPPGMGWRKTVYVLTGHVVNLGAGPAERKWLDWVSTIKGNIPGTYAIGVIGIKGGVGKTRVTAGAGTAFRKFRKEPVIAIDANPTYGGLGRLVDPRAAKGIREFLSDPRMTGYTRARQYTGQNPQGLEVLAGNQNVANPLALSPERFAAALAKTRKFYDLALIDCGPDIEHPVMAGVLCAVDSLVIIGSANIEGGLSAEQTINWLAARNGHELLRRSVLVINDIHGCASKKFMTHITQKLGPQVGAVKIVPWDVHLRDTATLDWEALRKDTQWALVELAAELASGFSTAGASAK